VHVYVCVFVNVSVRACIRVCERVYGDACVITRALEGHAFKEEEKATQAVEPRRQRTNCCADLLSNEKRRW
jgi:hypothetical protein